MAREFATVSKSLILRTATWAALGAIASGLEAWQVFDDIERATSSQEENALKVKLGVVSVMFFVASGQLIGAGLGYWFGFAWLMSNPVTIFIALLGIAYLTITVIANHYKRDGLRLWLHRCTWGRGTLPQWSGDVGHLQQMRALLEILQQPSVGGRVCYSGGGSTPRRWLGFWIQIQLPKTLAGKTVSLEPTLFKNNRVVKDEFQEATHYFNQQFLNGNWVDPQLFGRLPIGNGNRILPGDFTYTDTEHHQLWQVWIANLTENPVLELEITYPTEVLQRTGGRGYVFRLALDWETREADRLNDAFGGQLKEEADLAPAQNTTKITLNIPQ